MTAPATDTDLQLPLPVSVRGRLFRKYIALFVAVVSVALIANGLFDIWFSYREQRLHLSYIQREQAEAAAARISQFVKEIESQMGWTTQVPWSAETLNDWRFDAVRLLRQVPAITEISQLDSSGREQVRMSRLAVDVVASQMDFSHDPKFVQAVANKRYYGPVYFRRESEPYMTLSIAGARRDYGAVAAEVNLKFIWDEVSQVKVGKDGAAYVVDSSGRLIAHPDISLVLRNTDFSHLAQVQAARERIPVEEGQIATDIHGRQVLTANAPVAAPGWMLFVELPVAEAYAPLYASILRSGAMILAALIFAALAGIFLARRMVVPIEALRDGAARIGSGNLGQRIIIDTGDELQALGDQFNSMAARLQESYATLERKVEERTDQLERANVAKSRFLAAASHDLRQPLHALGLFVAQLRTCSNVGERMQVVDRIDSAVAAMNELFNALLDISKLDAGVLTPSVSDFSIDHLFKRIDETFAESAKVKGLSLRIIPTKNWVRGDFILLERILLNLVSNALRYTSSGGVIVGCRKRGDALRIEIWDTGAGIPEDQRDKIFGEFYRLGEPDRDRRAGIGLGLAIVDRLAKLLGHEIELTSIVGTGSRFSVIVPAVRVRTEVVEQPVLIRIPFDIVNGKLLVVIDDDPLVLDGMGGLFRSWGCHVVTASSDTGAIDALADYHRAPDAIISDYCLVEGKTGIDVIERLRQEYSTSIPAFLISGDTNPELLHDARTGGFHLLHKPVDPMALRTMLNRMLKELAKAS